MRVVVIGAENGQIAKAAVEAAASGSHVRCFAEFGQAIAAIGRGEGADILLMDVSSPIADAIHELSIARIYLPVIAYGRDCPAPAAAAAIRAGARDFLPLPPETDLIAAMLSAFGRNDRAMIYSDPRMQEVVALAEQFAPAEATVLITGESGTGKEVMARLVHKMSRRKDRDFISVNCAAIPENLLESELFGHEKGAFTGASSQRIGKFEEADQGTLLLDEISEMDVRLQAKLLRAIQEREIDRVGGRKPVPVNIRLIATSNRDLGEAVRQGQFREDLLFRLNVLTLELPALRERPQDISALAVNFADKYAVLNHVAPRQISDQADEALRSYDWPGNVRELENCLHRAVLLAHDGLIHPHHLRLPMSPGRCQGPDPGSTSKLVGRTVADVERELILDTLASTEGNRTRAAEILGISIRTLRNKLHLYGPEQVGTIL